MKNFLLLKKPFGMFEKTQEMRKFNSILSPTPAEEKKHILTKRKLLYDDIFKQMEVNKIIIIKK